MSPAATAMSVVPRSRPRAASAISAAAVPPKANHASSEARWIMLAVAGLGSAGGWTAPVATSTACTEM